MVIIDRYLLQIRLYINYKGKTIYYTPFTSNCCSCIKKLIFFFILKEYHLVQCLSGKSVQISKTALIYLNYRERMSLTS